MKEHCFAVWVVGNFHDSRTGQRRNLVMETARAFEAAGLSLYTEAVILQMLGSAMVRVNRNFTNGRKLTSTHQHILVFVKGDGKKAAQKLGPVR